MYDLGFGVNGFRFAFGFRQELTLIVPVPRGDTAKGVGGLEQGYSWKARWNTKQKSHGNWG